MAAIAAKKPVMSPGTKNLHAVALANSMAAKANGQVTSEPKDFNSSANENIDGLPEQDPPLDTVFNDLESSAEIIEPFPENETRQAAVEEILPKEEAPLVVINKSSSSGISSESNTSQPKEESTSELVHVIYLSRPPFPTQKCFLPSAPTCCSPRKCQRMKTH